MTLVDTSVWVDHLRRHNTGLAALLDRGEVVCHPFVVGELSLGSIRNRDEVLALLSELPTAPAVAHEDALSFVEGRGLAGRGIGWVDVHLAASALVGRLTLWTMDKRLANVARALRIEMT